ncbi:MAG: hypothetical protein ABW080_09585 [Candidatus Thiodiazotropha sp.]
MKYQLKISITIILIATLSTNIFARTPIEGKDYVFITNKPHQKFKDVIADFFVYGCKQCEQVRQVLLDLQTKDPKKYKYVRYPALIPFEIVKDQYIYNPRFIASAKVHYLAESLGVSEKVRETLKPVKLKYFDQLTSDGGLFKFFTNFNINQSQFNTHIHSFRLEVKMKQAENFSDIYLTKSKPPIVGVPQIIVNGKYRTSFKMVNGDLSQFEEVINYLIEKR